MSTAEAPSLVGTVTVCEVADIFRPRASRSTYVREWVPGLTARALLSEGWDAARTELGVNGSMARGGGWDVPLQPADVVTLTRRPGDPVDIAVAIAVALTVAIITRLLFPLEKPRDPNDNSNSIYGWSGVRTNYNAAGLPFRIHYGEHKTGGDVLSQYVEVIDGAVPQSYLWILLSLGVGPFNAIGQITSDSDDLTGDALPDSLKLQNNEASNFDGVTAWTRMGTLSQEAVPGFNAVRTQYPVDLPIDQVSKASNDPPVIDWSMAAGYDMAAGQTADSVIVGLAFPGGLFAQTADGNTDPRSVSLQVRYTELDEAGNPVGAPTIAYFGFDDTIIYKTKKLSPFTKQLTVPLYDPATFMAPTLSNALSFSATNKQWGRTYAAPTLAPEWVAGAVVDEMSAVAVINVRASQAINHLFGNRIPVSVFSKGVRIYLYEVVTGESQVVAHWGTGTASDSAIGGSVLDDTPTMVGFTYARAVAAGGLNRMRVYVDGQLVIEKLSAINIVIPAPGFWWNAATGAGAASATSEFGQLDHDEFRLFNRELTPDQILALHADGEWVSGSAAETGLVLGFHHDQVVTAGAQKFSPSYVPGQPDMELLSNSGTPTAIAGFVTNNFANVIKRGRYRIEVQRTNVEKESLATHDLVRFDHLITVLDDEVAYAGVALLALRILATDQLSGSAPNITVVAQGMAACPIWDGVNPDAPTFTLAYSANPADQLAQLLLDPDNGAGNYFGVEDIDWTSWKVWRDACATRVYDQRGTFTASNVAYAAAASGFDGAVLKLTLPTPRPVHLVLGKGVRVTAFAAPASDYPAGDYVIRQIVPVDEGVYQLWFDWPADTGAPAVEDVADASAATLAGTEGRHECHLVLVDRDLKMWDAAQLIASVGRAFLVRLGDKLRVIYDGPRDPVALFTPANIVADTFKLTTTRIEESFNSAVAEIQDRDLDWERNPIPRDHPSLTDGANTSKVRRRVFDLRGVTKMSQALRDLDYRLAVNHEVQLGVEFEAALDATFLEPGDVFVLTHPMPNWSYGGRLLTDSTDTTHITVDVPLTIGSKNLLSKTGALHTVAQWSRTGANPPTLVSSTEPGPDGVANAAVFDFGAVQSVLRYGRPLKDAHAYGASVYAKVIDGLGPITINLNVDNGDQAFVIDDDGLWHRAFELLVAGSADWLDIELTSRRIALTWAQLERDQNVTAYEAVDVASAATFSAAVRDSETDLVSFAAVDPSEWGVYAAGETILLSETLPSVPVGGWIWALGPYAEASLQFQVVDTTLTTDFRRRISGLQYVPSVYPADDAFPDLPASLGGQNTTPTSVATGALTLPSLAGSLSVTEEAARDPNTGVLTLALGVSWSHDAATVQAVERTLVWLAEDGDSHPEQVGEVVGRGTFFRIEGVTRRLAVGAVFRVWVQPVTRGGVRRALRRCRSAAISILGLFPVPDEAPTAGSVTLAGDQATYRVTLPAGFSDRIVDLWRGQPFIGQSVGRVPVGGSELPPTYNWVQLPAAADGRTNPPLVARLVGVNGARGDFLRVESALVPSGFGAPLLAASCEDGPFDTAPAGFSAVPVLTGLQLVPPAPDGVAQRLSWTGSALTASYQSTIFDLGEVRRVHISAGFEGEQVAAETLADLHQPIGSQYMRSWTPEGFTDPSHPLYGVVTCELQWAHSADSADPGSGYEPFVPGLAYVRSCRFRLALTRPTAGWDVLLDRFAVSIRPMRGTHELLMQDGVTSPPVPIETEAGDDWLTED